MPRLITQGFFVNGTSLDPEEIGPHELIEKFFGFDWGAPLESVSFILETDDKHRVKINIGVPKQRSGDVPVTEWSAYVMPLDGPEVDRGSVQG